MNTSTKTQLFHYDFSLHDEFIQLETLWETPGQTELLSSTFYFYFAPGKPFAYNTSPSVGKSVYYAEKLRRVFYPLFPLHFFESFPKGALTPQNVKHVLSIVEEQTCIAGVKEDSVFVLDKANALRIFPEEKETTLSDDFQDYFFRLEGEKYGTRVGASTPINELVLFNNNIYCFFLDFLKNRDLHAVLCNTTLRPDNFLVTVNPLRFNSTIAFFTYADGDFEHFIKPYVGNTFSVESHDTLSTQFDLEFPDTVDYFLDIHSLYSKIHNWNIENRLSLLLENFEYMYRLTRNFLRDKDCFFHNYLEEIYDFLISTFGNKNDVNCFLTRLLNSFSNEEGSIYSNTYTDSSSREHNFLFFQYGVFSIYMDYREYLADTPHKIHTLHLYAMVRDQSNEFVLEISHY